MLLALFETPAGYALFKVLDEEILNADLVKMAFAFRTADEAKNVVQLIDYQSFSEISDAVASTMAGNLGEIPDPVELLLGKLDKESNPTLLVSDYKLGQMIMEKLEINFLCNSSVLELMRCIRSQLHGLLSTTTFNGSAITNDMHDMSFVLAQSVGLRKIQTSPNMVDSMIRYVIRVHDDLEKNLKVYFRRIKSWYGDHFPELRFIIEDDATYVKALSLLWHRCNADETDFSSILPPEVETKVKELAKMSTGAEINPPEFPLINDLADQIVEMLDLKTELSTYLDVRMPALAPNVTALVGSLIGARLISEAGSLINLAKKPASAISSYGASKALFRALREKKGRTPKHGHLFNSKFVQEIETAKNRGKVSRALACKIVLAARVDSFGECSSEDIDFASASIVKIEARLKRLNEEALIRMIKETDKSPAIDLLPVPTGTAPSASNSAKVFGNGNSLSQNQTVKNKSLASESRIRTNFSPRRKRLKHNFVTSNKREYEKVIRSQMRAESANMANNAPVARNGVKRTFENSFPVWEHVDPNLVPRNPPKKPKFADPCYPVFDSTSSLFPSYPFDVFDFN